MLQTIITSGIIYLAVLVVIFVTANQDKPTGKNVVKLHPIFLVFGIIGFVLFAALTVLMILKSEFAVAWVFLAAGILASLMILGYFNSRIFFSKTSMTCRNLFRKKTVIPYREILSVDVDMDTVIKTSKKKITIYNYMRGGPELMSAIKNYEDSGDHSNDTVAPDKKVKAEDKSVRKFSESVNRLSTVMFLYIFCIVLAAGIAAFLLYLLFTDSPLKQDEDFGLFVAVGFVVVAFLVGYVVLAVCAAKRAHRSKTWRAIAKKLIRNGYLKED